MGTKQTVSQLGLLGSCVWLLLWTLGVILGWLVGMGGLFTLTPIIDSAFPTLASTSLQFRNVIFTISGLAFFVAAVSVWHYVIVLHFLPRMAQFQWLKMTIMGATSYWLVTWILYFFLTSNGTLGLTPLLRASEIGSPTETLLLLAISGVGAIVGAVTMALLAIPEWLVLHVHMSQANWWFTVIIIGSAIIMATLFGISAWLSQGMGWL